jgi:hypothetical protein
MQPATIVQLPSTKADRRTRIRLDDEHIVVERLVLTDRALAAFVGQRAADQQAALVEQALRVGLHAIQSAGTTLDVDVVRREFGALLERTAGVHERAAEALDGVLRTNFADGDGRLPRTLERFLGNRGELNRLVTELFDEDRRDSAIGRLRSLLGTYFDGDGSRLAQLLDPTRLGSPLHQFRAEINDGFSKLNDRLTALEASAASRAAERAKSAAKGTDFEDVLEELLAGIARGAGDALERTGNDAGDVIRSRKGDFVLTIDPRLCRGADLRVVVEAKDRPVSARSMRDELAAAKDNRRAAVALVCFSREHAPPGIAPFDVRGGDVYCALDPAAPEIPLLEAALRLARLLALATLRDETPEVDVAALATSLEGIRGQLDAIRGLKAQLTSIGSASQQVSAGLERLRDGVLARVGEAETLLRPTAAD